MSDTQDGQRCGLVDAIAASLSADGQYRELADSPERIELVRRCGRAAGRREQIPVRTFANELDDAGTTEVWVVNTKPIDPDDDELGQRRLRQRLRAAVDAAASDPDLTQ